jgi:hypothetical protein
LVSNIEGWSSDQGTNVDSNGPNIPDRPIAAVQPTAAVRRAVSNGAVIHGAAMTPMEAAPGRQKSRSVSIRLLKVVDGIPEGHKIAQLAGVPCAFTPDYAPEEMFKIANKLYQKSR